MNIPNTSEALLKAIQAEKELQKNRAIRPVKIPVLRIPLPGDISLEKNPLTNSGLKVHKPI